MDLTTLGLAMGTAWLSGVNLYATVLSVLLFRYVVRALRGAFSRRPQAATARSH